MPRNGSGVYSKAAGTTAVPNSVIESSKYNATIDDLVTDANTPRPIVAGGTGAGTVAGAQSNLSLDNKVVYAAKTGAYTALPADNNGVLRFTATATLSLNPVATLLANWHVIVIADGGAVTIDPNGTEQINGATSLLVQDGQTAFIVCDGVGFFARVIDSRTFYSAAGSNYTAVSADNNGVKRFTATATLTLTAAATLGANWQMTVIADGGDVTIDPNGSETINGTTSVFVCNGSSATIICDGTAFYMVMRPTAWETIRNEEYAAASSYVVTNLAPFVALRMTFRAIAASAATIFLQVSTDNGSTWVSGASDYFQQVLGAASTVVSATSSSNNAFQVSNGVNILSGGNGLLLTATLEGFNKSRVTYLDGRSQYNRASDSIQSILFSDLLVAGTHNALRIFTSGGLNITGHIILEGVRG